MTAVIVVGIALLPAGPAVAHGVGTCTLRLTVEGATLRGEWEINLRDARLALGLDPALAGEAGWRDLRGHEAELRALLVRQVSVATDSLACPVAFTPAPMEWVPQFEDVHLKLGSTCPRVPARLTLHSDLLFDRVPTYRVYFSVEDERATSVGVLRTNARTATFGIQRFDPLGVLREFIREGVWHIGSGLDHILFLLALLLPAPLLRVGSDWSPRAGFGRTLREVIKVVTAFTLAHSVPLCLSSSWGSSPSSSSRVPRQRQVVERTGRDACIYS